ncbi:hypothetical protein [Parafilimonas sp.]|uniref:hypothetical protein n=1 Tax=Parafilimonas sp. TaxID=1969739 RepID=UPI0039E37215
MEKAGLLITRLLELYNNKAGNEQLRITAQLLLSELERVAEKEQQGGEAIAVFFPAARGIAHNEAAAATITVEAPTPEPVMHKQPEPVKAPATEPVPTPRLAPVNEEDDPDYFNPMTEIPTLALKQQEINETMAQQESLNDRLKQSSAHKEVGNNISGGPIKDLRRGIGINDQYLFINELFRGDQTMYDRSIKTINSFNIYGEAELWIKRELKLKLGWNENGHASLLFDQLVRRRFS